MPQVAVQINGKTYRMACDEGQEAHLLDLAQRFDRTIHQLKGSFGEIGDGRLTVMAGVMVTDELVELSHKVRGLEAELAELRTKGAQNFPQDSQENIQDTAARDAHLASALTKAAERIETISSKLEDIEQS
ncbi:MAG: cell division protein ZapA [Pseudomonadota bacterium]